MTAYFGVTGLFRQLLDRGHDADEVSAENPNGSALWAASSSGYEDLVVCLLFHGAKVGIEHELKGIP